MTTLFLYTEVMRFGILLLALVIVGCAKPKEPTYLKCTTGYDVDEKLYVVLDHENELWISTSTKGSLDEQLSKYGLGAIYAQKLYTDERTYYKLLGEGEDQEKFYLDRVTLRYKSLLSWQCEVTDANPLLRSLGIEKGRVKI